MLRWVGGDRVNLEPFDYMTITLLTELTGHYFVVSIFVLHRPPLYKKSSTDNLEIGTFDIIVSVHSFFSKD